MKVIVCGTRDVPEKYNYDALESVLDELQPIEFLIHGGCKNSPDMFAERYADGEIAVRRFPADWEGLGKSAGFVRNRQMAVGADECVALWDGKSRGTLHMITEAVRAGAWVRIIPARMDV